MAEPATIENHTPVLIVARPGRLRDAWRALLMAAPYIREVYQADDATSAFVLVERHRPHLVLLDSELGNGEPWILLSRIKAAHPTCGSVVLVCNSQQRLQAEAAGADAILVRGFSAERLFQIVEQLLHEQNPRGGSLDPA